MYSGLYDFGPKIGDQWRLVRRVRAGNSWHPATDNLKGSDDYGVFVNDITIDATFSRPFSDDFHEFLFATGDMQVL